MSDPTSPIPDSLIQTNVREEAEAVESRIQQGERLAQLGLSDSLEMKLKELDALLIQNPDALDLRFRRAALLIELGRAEEAKRAYAQILIRAPGHFVAMNNLATLFHEMGDFESACTVYAETVTRHPDQPMGHANFGNTLYRLGQLEASRQHYETALKLNPDHIEAHQALGHLLMDLGEEELGAAHRKIAFRNRVTKVFPYHGKAPPTRLLLLASAEDGNVPINHFLDDHVIQTTRYYAEFHDPVQPLPPHDLIFNAIGDADRCKLALQGAIRALSQTTAPVINSPSAVLLTGRAANASRLARIPGVITPKTLTLPRETLEAPDAIDWLSQKGFTFPFLLRSPGFHTGYYFIRVSTPEEFVSRLPSLPGRQLAVIEYLDAHRADGKICKYRVMMIDGQFHPLHAAVSHEWKIHFFSAEMVEHPEHRAEDEAFLEKMPRVLGPLAMEALKQIRDMMGLEYAGVDFSLNEKGEILLFEANATMRMIPPKAEEKWNYRVAPVRRAIDAFQQMLVRKAKRPTPLPSS